MKRIDKPSNTYPPVVSPSTASVVKKASSAAAFSFADTNRLPGWVLLPLRLFLGITFVYAGVQKLTDPQFFNRAAPGYIGRQIIAFAHGSPLHNVLMQVALPHAHLFGLLIAFGEIAIGVGTLAGLLFRPAAFFGMMLSIIFFLTASWHVFPYFYGSDIVFTFCWLTLLLCGPLGTGLPALDSKLAAAILEDAPAAQRTWLVSLLSFLLGVPRLARPASSAAAPEVRPNAAATRGAHQRRQSYAQRARETRRVFLLGLVSGGGSVLALAVAGLLLRRLGSSDEGTALAGRGSGNDSGVAGTLSTSPSPTAIASPQASTSSGGTVIAQVSAVPRNSAVNFTIPSNGDPGVLVHLSNNQFVAYDATCTHAGCQVGYDQSSGLLICPCHGAEFDPAQNAAVVQGPAPTPLAPVAIHVNSATGAITM